MNLPSWLSRLFEDLTAPSPSMHPLALPPQEEDLPPAPPVLSCFVQGIIRSLETEPGQWEPYHHSLLYGFRWRHKVQLVHISEGYRAIHSSPPTELPGTMEDYDLTPAECAAVYDALRTYVIDPTERAQSAFMDQRRAERAADLAARKAAFEKLGCPTPSTTPSP